MKGLGDCYAFTISLLLASLLCAEGPVKKIEEVSFSITV